jgi:hypothetical protein
MIFFNKINKNLKGKKHFGDLGIDGRVIVKWIWKSGLDLTSSK